MLPNVCITVPAADSSTSRFCPASATQMLPADVTAMPSGSGIPPIVFSTAPVAAVNSTTRLLLVSATYTTAPSTATSLGNLTPVCAPVGVSDAVLHRSMRPFHVSATTTSWPVEATANGQCS